MWKYSNASLLNTGLEDDIHFSFTWLGKFEAINAVIEIFAFSFQFYDFQISLVKESDKNDFIDIYTHNSEKYKCKVPVIADDKEENTLNHVCYINLIFKLKYKQFNELNS